MHPDTIKPFLPSFLCQTLCHSHAWNEVNPVTHSIFGSVARCLWLVTIISVLSSDSGSSVDPHLTTMNPQPACEDPHLTCTDPQPACSYTQYPFHVKSEAVTELKTERIAEAVQCKDATRANPVGWKSAGEFFFPRIHAMRLYALPLAVAVPLKMPSSRPDWTQEHWVRLAEGVAHGMLHMIQHAAHCPIVNTWCKTRKRAASDLQHDIR